MKEVQSSINMQSDLRTARFSISSLIALRIARSVMKERFQTNSVESGTLSIILIIMCGHWKVSQALRFDNV
jgi:hypothetical protein